MPKASSKSTNRPAQETDPDEEPEVALPKPGKKRKTADASSPSDDQLREQSSKKLKKPKKPKEREPDEEEPGEEEPGEEEPGEEEPGEEEPGEEEPGEEEPGEEKSVSLSTAAMRRKKANYIDRIEDDSLTASGPDGVACLLSNSDAKRLMTFVPATPGATSYGLSEFTLRHNLFAKGVPASTARATQVRCDAVMRAVMNQAVLRIADSGKKQVNASTMAAVLRPYAERMELTSVVPPLGLIRYAQKQGVLSNTSKDKERTKEEKQLNEKTKDIAEAWRLEKNKRAEERRAKALASA